MSMDPRETTHGCFGQLGLTWQGKHSRVAPSGQQLTKFIAAGLGTGSAPVAPPPGQPTGSAYWTGRTLKGYGQHVFANRIKRLIFG